MGCISTIDQKSFGRRYTATLNYMRMFIKQWFGRLLVVMTAIAMLAPLLPVRAASITSAKDTQSRLKISTLSNHEVMFVTPTGVASGNTIILTFNSDFSIAAGLTFTDLDLSSDTTPDGDCSTGETEATLAAAPSGATVGAVRTSATVITFTNGTTAIAAGAEICVQIGTNATNQSTGVEQVTNATTIGSRTLSISGTFGDTGTIALGITNDDQVTVTATVAPSLTFDLDSGTTQGADTSGPHSVALGTLSSATLTTSDQSAINSIFADIDTNADGGASITVVGANTGLNSASTSTTITLSSAEETIAAGSQEIGLCVESVTQTTGGPLAIGTQYDSGGTTANCTAANGGTPTVGRIETTATQILNTTAAPIAAGRAEVLVKASISGVTPAATDYTNTLTFIATGTF